MQFSLNDFLISVSFALDFIEMDRLGKRTNHGKRTAYLALCIAKGLGRSEEELYDTAAVALLHDNGLSESSLYEQIDKEGMNAKIKFESSKGHCIIGEKNLKDYPFLTNPENSILYHHERYDGTGFFNKTGDEIPLLAQVLAAADNLENQVDPGKRRFKEEDLIHWINREENYSFSPELASILRQMVKVQDLWENLTDDMIDQALRNAIPPFTLDLSLKEVQKITGILSKIIDSKSDFTRRHSRELAEKAARMADYYQKEKEEKIKLIIAADLHDLGKLAVPNSILDNPKALTEEEYELVKKHVYYTRIALEHISGFEEITEWAANHHEKLDGSGYPFGKTGKDLDFNSRLMGCLDVYQALTEERPYRKGMTHREAMRVLYDMSRNGLLDYGISNDIDFVFSNQFKET